MVHCATVQVCSIYCSIETCWVGLVGGSSWSGPWWEVGGRGLSG